MNGRRTVVLATRLFPDSKTVEDAIGSLPSEAAIERFDLAPERMDREQWDTVVRAILAADKIITV